jgi:hypothetical protein
LDVPAGWEVTPVGTHATVVAAEATGTHRYEVRIPAGQAAGEVTLAGSLAYRYQAGTATLPVAATLNVAPAVAIVSVAPQPAEVTPGAATTLSTVLRNRATVPVTGRLTVTGPQGWQVGPATEYELAPGAQATVQTPLTAPLTVTEGIATVEVAVGVTDSERRTVDIPVLLPNPPAPVLDHVDLGDPASEQAHNLTASEHSGTSVEAGLTRRYTHVNYPGGWFEFDLVVEPGKPFILRAIETYDQAQLKEYDVLVDGVVAHSRSYRRTVGGAGTVTYQFVVDLPQATSDGLVRVRFQHTGTAYDPSIADVWAMPYPADPAAGAAG